MKIVTLISLLFCLTLVQRTNAQDTGSVRFLVDVDNGYFEIVIDDTMYLKLYKANLPVGHHTARVWSPGYIITEVEFDIKKDEVNEKYVKMAISNERQDYEFAYKEYRSKFHKSLTLPLSITLGLGLTTGYFMMKSYDTRQLIYDDITLYHQAPTYSEVLFYKNRLENNNIKYNRLRGAFYTSLVATSLMVGTTIYTYRKFKQNNTEPTYNKESPFKEKFSLQLSPFGGRLIFNVG